MPPFKPTGFNSAPKQNPMLEFSPKPPEPPKPPTFPSLSDLLIGEVSAPPTSSRHGLFETLFGGNPEALLQDALDHPDQYDERLVTLSRDLYEKRRAVADLTKEERDILNMGTMDFAQYRPPPKQKTSVSPPRSLVTPELLTSPEPGVDIPFTDVRPYWWT